MRVKEKQSKAKGAQPEISYPFFVGLCHYWQLSVLKSTFAT